MKKRFFGAKCTKQMVKCCISPDGQYLVSGSENGLPFIWDATLEAPIESTKYECNFQDIVSDCDWNPRYNMFAVAGFGQEFPILIYTYERSNKEVEELFFRHGKLTTQNNVAEADP